METEIKIEHEPKMLQIFFLEEKTEVFLKQTKEISYEDKKESLSLIAKRIHKNSEKLEGIKQKIKIEIPIEIQMWISSLKNYEETMQPKCFSLENDLKVCFDVSNQLIQTVIYDTKNNNKEVGDFGSTIKRKEGVITNHHRNITEQRFRELGLSRIHEQFTLLYAKKDFNKIVFTAQKPENWTWALANGYLPRTEAGIDYLLKELFEIKNNFATEKQNKKQEIYFEKEIKN